jgi:hypothetical protein
MPSPIDRFIVRCRHSLLKDVLALIDFLPGEEGQDVGLRLRRAVGAIPTQLGDGSTPASAALIDRALSTTAEAATLLQVIREVGAAPEQASEDALLKVSAIRNMAELQLRRARGGPGPRRRGLPEITPFPRRLTLDGPVSFSGVLP